MKFAHVLSRLLDSPWFITPDALHAITDLLEARLRDVRMEGDYPSEQAESSPAKPYVSTGGIALIPVDGILGQRLGLMERMCGGCDYQSILAAARSAVADPAIRFLVFSFNSRGGTANGCTETFTALRELRAGTDKVFLAFTDSICASAAYYLAAACDQVYATPTARVGCIGSMLTVEDRSEALAKEGIKRFTIKSAAMKDIGNPDRPMTDEERSVLQAQIDYLGGLFRGDMQAARAQIADEVFANGLCYYGPEAQRLGLTDLTINSLDELVASLSPVLPRV